MIALVTYVMVNLINIDAVVAIIPYFTGVLRLFEGFRILMENKCYRLS